MEKISASSNISEIFTRWPQLITIFIEHDMSCPGCFMAPYENLGNALEIYELPLEPFIKMLNREIEKTLKKGKR